MRYTSAWFRGKRVTVMGLGLHGGGLAVARWMLRHGADVTVTDIKTRAQLRPSVCAIEKTAQGKGSGRLQLVLGGHRAVDFNRADIIVQNPGVPRDSRYLDIARHAHVPIENEASIFLQVVRATKLPVRIVGITGTRGKSTTAALIFAMLDAGGRRAFLAGNIRIPMFDILDRVIRAARHDEVDVVLELSSWHCEHLSAQTGSVDVAVFTNLLRDHLNRYASMRSYFSAKARLIRFQRSRAVAVLNADDVVVSELARVYKRDVRWFSSAALPIRTRGAYLDRAWVWVRDRSKTQRLAAIRNASLQGAHNAMNVAAATACAHTLGISGVAIRRAIREFRGLPGRAQDIATRNGIRYMNDTCATTPDASIAALRSITDGIVLIAGGTDKRLRFDVWAREVVERVHSIVFLPGTATDCMRAALKRTPGAHALAIYEANSMRTAVRTATKCAERGDVVLLSPGATSFGLFVHEFDRGDQFVQAVKTKR
ncbi:MAG: UDP-N-acetylmuramoyl-L-alanine--D-glutamate ligase [Candidatus Uhrbacteria bacterium]